MNDEIQETSGPEDVLENEIENIRSIGQKEKNEFDNGKGQKKFTYILIGILLTIVICTCVYLPRLLNMVSYDIEAEQLIQQADDKIDSGNFVEGINIYKSISETSRYYAIAQSKVEPSWEKYRNSVIDEVNQLISNGDYLAAWDSLQEVKEFVEFTDAMNDMEEQVKELIFDYVDPTVNVEYISNGSKILIESQELSVDDITMTLNFSDRFTETINPISCSPSIIETSGENTINLCWDTARKDYAWKIQVQPKVISMTASYTGNELTRGDKFEKKDFVVEGICSDESVKTINDFELSTTTVEKYGKNEIEISYFGITCKCEVSAKPQQTGITVQAKQPYYEIGKTIDKETGFQVNAQYEDGTTEILDANQYKVGSNPRTIGENTIKISYRGFEAETTIIGCKKIKLSELEEFDSDYGVFWRDTDNDFFGNEYSTCLRMRVPNQIDDSLGIYAKCMEYYLGMRYQSIEGKAVLSNISWHDEKAQFAIIADNQIVYTSPEIGDTTQPFSFSVNLRNAEYLKLGTISYETRGSDDCFVLIYDLELVQIAQ